jgi:hypothetical protein
MRRTTMSLLNEHTEGHYDKVSTLKIATINEQHQK